MTDEHRRVNPALLLTLGYSGIQPDLYFDTILAHGAQTLVDVRKIARSRKPGYSKKRLTEEALSRKIGYVHLPELGTPDEIRLGLKHGSAEFDRQYFEYLENQADALTLLAERVRREICCLLCVEADISECHRRIIAGRMVEIIGQGNIEVMHLSV